MNQLNNDVAKLRKVAKEVETYIKAELARALDDCVEELNGRRFDAHSEGDRNTAFKEGAAGPQVGGGTGGDWAMPTTTAVSPSPQGHEQRRVSSPPQAEFGREL